jgi:quaternary ammonium compound-resistance protein SugE
MEWIYLAIAGVFEVTWAIMLKYSEGFSKLVPSAGTVIFMILSFFFLSKAIEKIPIGTAYAVWTGIGAVGTAIIGIILLNESKDFPRLFFILLIVIGIFGIKLYSE